MRLTDRIPDYTKTKQLQKELTHRAQMPLLGTLIVYKLAALLLIAPAVRLIWAGALRLSPVHYITNSNLFSILKVPFVPAAILFIAVITSFWSLFEFSLIIHGLDCAVHKEQIRLKRLLIVSAADIRHVLKPINLPMLIYAAVLIPFTNVFVTSDYISQLIVPEYIMEVIRANPFYFVPYVMLFVLCLIATVFLSIALQVFILEKRTFAESVGVSVTAVRESFVSTCLRLLLRNLALSVKYGLIFILCAVAVIAGLFIMSIHHQELMRGLGNAMTYIQLPVFGYIFDCLTTIEQVSIISAIYYAYRHISIKYSDEPDMAAAVNADDAEGAANEVSGSLNDSSSNSPDLKKRKNPDSKFRIGHKFFAPAVMLMTVIVTGGFGALLAEAPELYSRFQPVHTTVSCHRGYSKVAPENTIPAFQAAIDIGADCAELDVQMTNDGVVVVSHDPSLKRTTGLNARICDLSYAEVSALDAGSFFSEEFAGTHIPTLEDVLKLCKDKIRLNIEIKHNAASPELEAKTVQLIKDYGFKDSCVITSLSYESLSKVKELDPDIRTGYILAVGAGNYYDLPAADFFSVEISFITPGMISALHQRGKTISAWTVNRESDAEKLKQLGVDDMITEDPLMVRTVIETDTAIGDAISNAVDEIRRNENDNTPSDINIMDTVNSLEEALPEDNDLDEVLGGA